MSEQEPSLEELREVVEYPVFNPTVVPTQIDENTLHIRGGPWNGPVLTLTDHEEEDIIFRLVDLIDGETHVDDVLGAFHHDDKGEVARALGQLAEKGAIHDAADYDEDSHYHHTALKPFENVEDYTAGIEVESVGVVTTSDIARHVIADVQEMPVESVTVSEPVRETSVGEVAGIPTTDDPVEDVVADNDFVIYAAEQPYPELEELVNETTHAERTPWMSIQRLGYDGLVGPTIFPGETACYECFKARKLSNVVSWENYQAFRDAYRGGDQDASTETLPEFNRMLAGMAAMDLRHLFAHGVGYTAGRVIATSSLDLTMNADRVLKQPRCDVCGPGPAEKSSPFVSLEDFVRVNAPERYGDD